MKAQDIQILKALNEIDANFQSVVYASDRRIYKAGIKEVVEWIISQNLKVSTVRALVKSPLWQSKLKEWGLEDECH